MMSKNTPEKDINFIVRLATSKEDYDYVAKIAKEEQWVSLGAHSIAHVGPVAKPGFFIGWLNGQRIGMICVVKYGSDVSGSYYHLGNYAIDKTHRGKGYGMKLCNEVWETLDKDCDMCADGVLHMASSYQIWGFCQEWLNKEYVVLCSKVVEAFQEVKEKPSSAGVEINSLSEVDFDRLFMYDTSVFGFPRYDFLQKWITIPESLGWVATNKMGDIIGYIVIRYSVIDKHQIVAPLFSDDLHVARTLLYVAAKAAIKQKSAEKLVLWTPAGANPDAANMVETEIGFENVFETVRMYTNGIPPSISLKKTMATTSPGFG